MITVEQISKSLSTLPHKHIVVEGDKVICQIDDSRMIIVNSSKRKKVIFTYFFNRNLLVAHYAPLDKLTSALRKLIEQ